MTLHQRVAEAREAFRRAGIPPDEAAIDAEILARHALGLDRAGLLARLRDPAPSGFIDAYEALVSRRASREPMAYIVGHREFWGLEFEITPDVLIPRPETEFIIEQCLALSKDRSPVRRVADIGTGSGCLAVSLAREFPGARITATDISPGALAVARLNAERHGVGDRIAFLETDLLNGIGSDFDLIVSNPPYVPAHDREQLQAEVARFEPMLALFAGPTGLAVITRLLREAAAHLAATGLLVVEFGFGQESAVLDAASASGWHVAGLARDYQDIPRVVTFRR